MNSEHLEAWFLVDPDEDYLLFSSFGRPSGDGLYVSFRGGDNTWSAARSLGEDVNGIGQARMPRLSPDGRILFFNVDSRSGPLIVETVKQRRSSAANPWRWLLAPNLLVMVALPPCCVQAQPATPFDEVGRFYVRNLARQDYDAHAQNWAIVQGPDGLLPLSF